MPTNNIQKFLDNQTGLPTLFSLIEGRYVVKVDGMGLSSNDFTNDLKRKLEGLMSDGSANQDAFSNIIVGDETLAAGSETDSFELAEGDNVTIEIDTNAKKITISAKDTTYAVASSTLNGLMSSEDFDKLAAIATGAEVNVIESVSVNGEELEVDAKGVNIEVPTKTSDLTNDSTYQTKDQVDAAISSAVASVYVVKGSVDTADDLPTDATAGDVYNIKAKSDYGPAGMNVVWAGDEWDALGSSITIDAMTAADVQDAFATATGAAE